MKLTHAIIENFKGIRRLELDFMSNGSVRPLTAILGDNGSGKTTALQAIALILSMAGRKTLTMEQFRWHGFLPERISTLGKTVLRLWVEFDDTEIELTQRLFHQWERSLPEVRRESMKLVPPAGERTVRLCFENGALDSPDGFGALNQFAGRYYVRALLKSDPSVREYFASLGDVFVFDQMRNLGQARFSPEQYDNRPDGETWQAGVEQLREFLIGWWAHHTSPEHRGRDYIPDLKKALQLVFPGMQFAGVAPRGTGSGSVSDFYFLLEQENRVFDISEMSSGEQAVFPLMYEFVRLDIAKSVVLIDELELHLHPPQQQALLAALPRIGPDCQFIITTHSPYLEGAIPDEHEIRLPGGRPCL